ncbi:hypothetical protein FPZ49_26130 [Paenibacillus cremeus]|uniref:Uncharacterized protein n=1 Tax=Paenibacillus cremeus TaxID=2163881 RepID=A0A559K4G6_9BACL|nr:hypothetical protein FPZ49_26130 [Paenibacillus cremeus]
MVMGLAMHKIIKTYLFSPYTVLVSLVIGGIFMIMAERRVKTITAETVADVVSEIRPQLHPLIHTLAAEKSTRLGREIPPEALPRDAK